MEHQNESTIVNAMMESDLLQAEWVLYFLLVLFALSTVIVLWKIVYFGLNRVRAQTLRSHVAQLVAGGDPLQFRDQKKYPDRMKEARKKTGEEDSVIGVKGKVNARIRSGPLGPLFCAADGALPTS